MPDLDPQRELDALKALFAALQHEHDKVKHLLNSPQSALKLAIFDRFPMPIWACDRECRIVFWNESAARLYGYSSEEAIGRDFVSLFVNPPEMQKARLDCVDIIDQNKLIKNMAEDIDKHGTTKKIVTQCFPIYNVDCHSGLQVEISYEVQDIERLAEDLLRMQGAYRREQEEKEELLRKLVDVTRTRALNALDSMISAIKDSLRTRLTAAETAELSRDSDPAMIAKARSEVKVGRERLLKWERRLRQELMSVHSADDLESMIISIENGEGLDV